MKIGVEIPEMFQYLPGIVAEDLIAKVMAGADCDRAKAEAVVAVRIVPVLPSLRLEESDGSKKFLGSLVAAHLLRGRKLEPDSAVDIQTIVQGHQDLCPYLAALVAQNLISRLESAQCSRAEAEAIVAARIVTETPLCQPVSAGQAEEHLGRLVAGHILQGRTLAIDASDGGLSLTLEATTVPDAKLRRVLDFDLFAYLHAEWMDTAGADEAFYELADGGKIDLTGSEEVWERYHR